MTCACQGGAGQLPRVAVRTLGDQLAVWSGVVREAATDQTVMAAARRAVADWTDAPARMGDGHAYEAAAVDRYIRDRVAYVREPGEVIAAPAWTLATGAGDCDDLAALAGGMLASLGWTVGPVLVDGAHLAAWCQAPDGAGPVIVDPSVRGDVATYGGRTVAAYAGQAPPRALGADPCASVAVNPQQVPRDGLFACVQSGWGMDAASQAAAMEIGRRAWEGMGAQGGLKGVSLSNLPALNDLWVVHAVQQHGCPPVMLALSIVEGAGVDVGPVRDALKSVAGVLGLDCSDTVQPAVADAEHAQYGHVAVHIGPTPQQWLDTYGYTDQAGTPPARRSSTLLPRGGEAAAGLGLAALLWLLVR